jgi:hypothetical protein
LVGHQVLADLHEKQQQQAAAAAAALEVVENTSQTESECMQHPINSTDDRSTISHNTHLPLPQFHLGDKNASI